MPSLVDLNINLEVIDNLTSGQLGYEVRRRWLPGSGTGGVRQDIVLTALSFTAITIPTGSKFVLIDPGAAVSLTLKGITSDTGIAITPATGPLQIPILLPLDGNPSLGLLNSANVNQTVSVIFL